MSEQPQQSTPATVLPAIPGPKVMLVGGTGSGKTHSIRTLVNAGLEVFCLFTEPGMEVLADIPSDKLHWHYIPATTASWADMLDSAQKINTLSFKALAEMPDINKRKYTEFLNLISALADFPDDRTGQKFGPVDSWGLGRAFVFDSMSGLNIMAMNMVAGSKPVKSMADWGVAMDNLERLITKLTVDVRCPVVMIAHQEREADEVTGGTSIMVSTLGKKLAPKIPRFFSDVIHVKRDGTKFTWSTTTLNTDLKARNLPIADNQEPSFAPIIENWRKKLRDAGQSV